MEVIPLGTGAPLCPGRAGLGLLVRWEGASPLLIDTCGGLELADRLHRVNQPIESLKHVIVTHRHGDHMGGTMALALARTPCTYYGLPDTLEAIQQLIQLSYGEYDLNPEVRYQPVEAGKTYSIASYEVTFFQVQHRVPTLAVRLSYQGKVVAFSADSLPCEALIDAAKEADLFICDALCASSDFDLERVRFLKHPTALEAATMARAAGAKSLALVHLARFAKPEAMLQEARGIFPGLISIPQDCELLQVSVQGGLVKQISSA